MSSHIQPSKPNENEVLGDKQHDRLGLEIGTVGWEDDQGSVSDLDTTAQDGTTLVKVQLFRGRQNAKAVKPGVAQGIKILAQLSGPLWTVPARGQRVFVAIPNGMESTPGVGVIVAMPGPAPTTQYGTSKTKMDLGPDQDLVIKARSITLTTYNNQFISIVNGQGLADGVYIQDSSGTGITIQDGVTTINDGTGQTVLQMDNEHFTVTVAGNANILLMDENQCQFTGTNFICNTAACYLGYDPTNSISVATSGAVYCGPSLSELSVPPALPNAVTPESYLYCTSIGAPIGSFTSATSTPNTVFAGISSKVYIAP
jgi:hypothetical protein